MALALCVGVWGIGGRRCEALGRWEGRRGADGGIGQRAVVTGGRSRAPACPGRSSLAFWAPRVWRGVPETRRLAWGAVRDKGGMGCCSRQRRAWGEWETAGVGRFERLGAWLGYGGGWGAFAVGFATEADVGGREIASRGRFAQLGAVATRRGVRGGGCETVDAGGVLRHWGAGHRDDVARARARAVGFWGKKVCGGGGLDTLGGVVGHIPVVLALPASPLGTVCGRVGPRVGVRRRARSLGAVRGRWGPCVGVRRRAWSLDLARVVVWPRDREEGRRGGGMVEVGVKEL